MNLLNAAVTAAATKNEDANAEKDHSTLEH